MPVNMTVLAACQGGGTAADPGAESESSASDTAVEDDAAEEDEIIPDGLP